jgi:hypothetical protein
MLKHAQSSWQSLSIPWPGCWKEKDPNQVTGRMTAPGVLGQFDPPTSAQQSAMAT